MSGAQRRKGREGENELRKLFAQHGWKVRPLQPGRVGRDDGGDFIAEKDGVTVVADSKRREKVRVVEWARGVERTAHDGEIPVSGWRQSNEPWRVTLLAEDFARLRLDTLRLAE